ncbi:hypothetical protein D3C72_1942370 [compost metagenome]
MHDQPDAGHHRHGGVHHGAGDRAVAGAGGRIAAVAVLRPQAVDDEAELALHSALVGIGVALILGAVGGRPGQAEHIVIEGAGLRLALRP